MKQLITIICFLFATSIASAQGYNPIKNIKPDVNWNEHFAHAGFGWTRIDNETVENITSFRNNTDEVLEVHFRVPAIGVDTVYFVPPAMHDWDFAHFTIGYNLIPTEGWLLKSLMVECTVRQINYDFTLRYIWARQVKKYF